MTIEQRIEKLKTRGIENEEFFLIFNGQWCVGYMFTPGLMPEMDVQVEFSHDTIHGALDQLENFVK